MYVLMVLFHTHTCASPILTQCVGLQVYLCCLLTLERWHDDDDDDAV